MFSLPLTIVKNNDMGKVKRQFTMSNCNYYRYTGFSIMSTQLINAEVPDVVIVYRQRRL